MRIALLSYEYPTETGFGGIGTYTWYQARALARLGHEVHVLAGSIEPCILRREEHDGVTVFRHRHLPPWGRMGRWLDKHCMWWTKNRIETAFSMKNGLGRLLQEVRYDIVEMPECGGEGAFLSADLPVPTLVKFHSPAQLIMGSYDLPSLDRALCPRIEARGIQRATALSSCSRFLADEVQEKMSVDRHVEVIANGIDLQLFDAGDELDVESRFEIPRDRPMIFFCGRLERRKGIHVMKDVAPRLLAEHDVTLVFAGQDLFEYGQREIEPLLSRRELRGSYRFLGRLTPREVRSCLRRAEIFVMPSLWENCPYSCLEAMSARCAIVASDAGGLPELIRHEENGLIARVGNVEETLACLSRLLDDEALMGRLAEAARGSVERSYTDEAIAQKSLSYYDRSVVS